MERKFEQIEKYLLDEMTVREQVEFEESLRKDPELMKEFLLRKEINHAIQEDDIFSLRDELNLIAESENLNKNNTRRLYIYVATAAAIALLFIAYNFYNHSEFGINQNELAGINYETYPSVTQHRSGNKESELDNNFSKAFIYYENQNYQKAEEYFYLVFNEDNSNAMSQFYLSICKLETGKFLEAEEYLNDLILKQDHLFWEQAHWYLAIAYIKQDKNKLAKKILKKIIDEDMSFKNESKKALRLLR